MVAPLLARRRTLGALSVLRLGDSEPYGRGSRLRLRARPAGRAGDRQRAPVLRGPKGRAAPRGDFRQPRRGDHDDRSTRPDRLRQPGRGRPAGGRHPGRAHGAPPGVGHGALYHPRRAGPRARPASSMPRRRMFAGEIREPLLLRNIVRAHRRGALADRPPVAVHDPDSGASSMRSMSTRTSPRSSARSSLKASSPRPAGCSPPRWTTPRR